jgi:divalent metal cation (Fe/Co/Zn/Cd) transporter
VDAAMTADRTHAIATEIQQRITKKIEGIGVV